MNNKHLLTGALVNGALNAVINGLINWFTLDKEHPAYLTQDSISSSQHTVFSGAVPLAVSLAFILTSIAYLTTKKPGKPAYFPRVFVLALKHSVFAFGLVAIAGLLIQRFLGQIEVSHVIAATLAGIIAGLVAGIVDYETKKQL
ncbi:MAG: hypothetical protein MUF29_04335 [Chitinophagaceae bacterium]|jgi:hypothetical protein|nr:hypothetical protein [Chitinophagaceae bacterium]